MTRHKDMQSRSDGGFGAEPINRNWVVSAIIRRVWIYVSMNTWTLYAVEFGAVHLAAQKAFGNQQVALEYKWFTIHLLAPNASVCVCVQSKR